jgi:hypothetical protein
MAARSAEAADLLKAGSADRRVRDDGSLVLVLHGDEALHERVRDLVRREKECCPFFEFELTAQADELTVVARAPDEARPLLEGLFAA